MAKSLGTLWMVIIAAAMLLAVAGTAAPGAKALSNCTVSDNTIDAQEQAFLGLINNYRAANGRPALTLSDNLNRSATWMAADMGAHAYFSHTDSAGRSPSTRARDCGYPSGAGENIAAGTAWDTASEVFSAWRNSSGHNANMLNSSYRKIGIARVYTAGSPYGWYWVTDFGLVDDGGSTGGGATATTTPTRTATAIPTRTATTVAPPPTATPVQQGGPAVIASPAPGSKLTGASMSFSWNPAPGAQQYFFYIGTSQGSNSIYGGSTGTATAVSVSNLPTDGRSLYARLWTRFGSSWTYTDSTYTAATSIGSDAAAALTSPAPGSTLSGSQVTFRWSSGSGALEYFFYLGTSAGANNLVGRSVGTGQSLTLSGIPTDGRTLYVRIWTRTASGWHFNDYTLHAAP